MNQFGPMTACMGSAMENQLKSPPPAEPLRSVLGETFGHLCAIENQLDDLEVRLTGSGQPRADQPKNPSPQPVMAQSFDNRSAALRINQRLAELLGRL